MIETLPRQSPDNHLTKKCTFFKILRKIGHPKIRFIFSFYRENLRKVSYALAYVIFFYYFCTRILNLRYEYHQNSHRRTPDYRAESVL